MIGYEYTITNKLGDSFKINDHTNPNRVIALQEYPISTIGFKNNEVSPVGEHGTWDFYSYYGSRVTTFSGVIIANNEAEVEQDWTQMRKVLGLPREPSDNYDGFVTVSYTDANGNTFAYDGKLFASPIPSRNIQEKYRLNFSFTLKSPDPYILGAGHDITNTYGYFIKGFRVPTPVPIPFVNEWQPKFDVTIDNYVPIGQNKEYSLTTNQDANTRSTNPNTNYGSGNLFLRSDITAYINFNQATVRSFLDLQNVYGVNQIEKVEMYIYAQNANTNTPPTNVKRVTEPWAENTITHTNAPNVTDVDSVATAQDWFDGASGNLVKLDITNIAKGWINGDYPCYGVELSTTGSGIIGIRSIENSGQATQLVVTYKDAQTLPPYNGNIASHAIYTITNTNPNNAPMTNPRIVDVERNIQTKLMTTLEVGQSITIDTKAGLITDHEGNDITPLLTDDSVFILLGATQYLPIFTADEQPQEVLYYPQGTVRYQFNDTII